MSTLNIKQAQFATDQGRLDEAFEILTKAENLEHKDGKRLAMKLGIKYIGRGNEHLSAGMTDMAMADCNKAAKLLGNTTEVSGLRKAIVSCIEEKQHAMRQNQAILAAAKENIQAGWMTVGKGILGSDAKGEAALLLQDAEAKRTKIAAVIEKANKALNDGFIEEAIEIVRTSQCSKEIRLYSSEFAGKLNREICVTVRENINIGRVDLAERMLDLLGTIDMQSLEFEELKSVVADCRKACGYIATGQLSRATELFNKLKIVVPKAKWIRDAASEAGKGARAIEELRAGPLGLITSRYVHADESNEVEAGIENKIQKQRVMAVNKVQSKFMLHVDGAGSWLVVNSETVNIGPVSSAEACDIKIIAAADMQPVAIERSDVDYFIRCKCPVGINEKAVTNGMLRNGDKIALTNRNMMKFKKANSASNTAELVPSGIRFTQAGITGVMLMDREILIGASGSNHIQTNDIKDVVTLCMRDGNLVCKSREMIEVDGNIVSNECVIGIGSRVNIGEMSFAVTEYSV